MNFRTKIIDDCFDMKNYLKHWGIYHRLKIKHGTKEILLKDILFSELNDEDLYEAWNTMKIISSQPMA